MSRVKPVRGEVDTIHGFIVARVIGRSGKSYLHLGPTGRGFASKIEALDFINRTMREGAVVTQWQARPPQPQPEPTFVKPVNEARAIVPAKVAHASLDRTPVANLKRSEERKANASRTRSYRSDGVTRCGKCPPRGYCDECNSLNRGRAQAGLIHPHGDHRPHDNNIALSPMSGAFRGHRPINVTGKGCPVVTAYLKNSRGGWRRGAAMLNGQDIYVGPPTRSKDEAWAFAKDGVKCIKIGLAFEDVVNG